MTDRLTLARALEEGGIARDAAEHIATEIFDAIHDNVATKADIAALRADLKATEGALRSDLAVAVRDVKIWTGSLFALVVAIVSGVVTIFHFLSPAASGH